MGFWRAFGRVDGVLRLVIPGASFGQDAFVRDLGDDPVSGQRDRADHLVIHPARYAVFCTDAGVGGADLGLEALSLLDRDAGTGGEFAGGSLGD